MKYKDLLKQNGFSLIIKIIIVCLLLNVVLVVAIMFSNNSHKNNLGIKDKEKIQEKKVINRDELTKTYKKDLTKLFDNFDGNFGNLRDQVANLVVPSTEFQSFHLNLVIALTSATEGSNDVAKERLTSISTLSENAWFKSQLDAIISKL